MIWNPQESIQSSIPSIELKLEDSDAIFSQVDVDEIFQASKEKATNLQVHEDEFNSQGIQFGLTESFSSYRRNLETTASAPKGNS